MLSMIGLQLNNDQKISCKVHPSYQEQETVSNFQKFLGFHILLLLIFFHEQFHVFIHWFQPHAKLPVHHIIWLLKHHFGGWDVFARASDYLHSWQVCWRLTLDFCAGQWDCCSFEGIGVRRLLLHWKKRFCVVQCRHGWSVILFISLLSCRCSLSRLHMAMAVPGLAWSPISGWFC